MWKFFNQYVKKYWPVYILGFLFLTITNFASVRIPLEIKQVIDGLETSSPSDLKQFVITIVILSIIVFVARTLSRLFFFIPGRNIEYDIRNNLYKHLIRLSPTFFKENKVGDLMSRLVNDLSGIRVFVALAALHIFNTTISYIFVFSQMFSISVPLTLYVIIPIPIAMIAVRFLVKKLYVYMVKHQRLLGEVTSKIVESLSNIHLIKSYAIEKPTISMFDVKNQEFLKNGIRLSTYRSSMFPFIGIIGSIGQCILFFVGGLWIIEGRMSVGEFTAMSMYLVQIVWPTASLAWIINIIQRGKASLFRVEKILDAKQYYFPEEKQASIPIEKASLSIKNLSFRFENDKHDTLSNISFTIPHNASIGIFGATGSGKSTLAKLLTRIEPVPSDSIYLNDIDISTMPVADYWALVSYVPQLSFLFSDSISENIGYANQHQEPPKQAVIESLAKKAAVYDDVLNFPNKFETVVGEKGIILSGGQKKRISLARALFKSHKILVLDDHLSAVDHETEQLINNAVFKLKNCIKIIVSHRISALINCDQIIVLDKGKIVAKGTHSDLIKQDGIYKDTWLYQQLEKQS